MGAKTAPFSIFLSPLMLLQDPLGEKHQCDYRERSCIWRFTDTPCQGWMSPLSSSSSLSVSVSSPDHLPSYSPPLILPHSSSSSPPASLLGFTTFLSADSQSPPLAVSREVLSCQTYNRNSEQRRRTSGKEDRSGEANVLKMGVCDEAVSPLLLILHYKKTLLGPSLFLSLCGDFPGHFVEGLCHISSTMIAVISSFECSNKRP